MWYQIQMTRLKPEVVDAISDCLENLGVLSITLTDQNDDPVLEPAPGTTPLWPEVKLTALFNTENEARLAQKIASEQFGAGDTAIECLTDQAWERVCMDHFQAQAFGDKLWICPSWCEPPDPDAVNIFLDPGLAFGTGSHPTTALCLQWLAGQSLDGQTVIDFGCGSGILAVAARKLGASRVTAVDIDPQALLATKDNAAKNNCFDENFKVGSPETLTDSADILLANILLEPLQSLRDDFAEFLNATGKLVVSGLLAEQVEGLIDHYRNHFRCLARETRDNWAMLVFGKAA